RGAGGIVLNAEDGARGDRAQQVHRGGAGGVRVNHCGGSRAQRAAQQQAERAAACEELDVAPTHRATEGVAAVAGGAVEDYHRAARGERAAVQERERARTTRSTEGDAGASG